MILMKLYSRFFLLALLLSACVSSAVNTGEEAQRDPVEQSTQTAGVPLEIEPTDSQIPPTSIPAPTQDAFHNLSMDLVRGCDRRDGTDPNLREGDPAVEFSLKDVAGSTFTLSELLNEKPVALIYGSFT